MGLLAHTSRAWGQEMTCPCFRCDTTSRSCDGSTLMGCSVIIPGSCMARQYHNTHSSIDEWTVQWKPRIRVYKGFTQTSLIGRNIVRYLGKHGNGQGGEACWVIHCCKHQLQKCGRLPSSEQHAALNRCARQRKVLWHRVVKASYGGMSIAKLLSQSTTAHITRGGGVGGAIREPTCPPSCSEENVSPSVTTLPLRPKGKAT
jgi:hypothetical protein